MVLLPWRTEHPVMSAFQPFIDCIWFAFSAPQCSACIFVRRAGHLSRETKETMRRSRQFDSAAVPGPVGLYIRSFCFRTLDINCAGLMSISDLPFCRVLTAGGDRQRKRSLGWTLFCPLISFAPCQYCLAS